jgi:hypothetical protein
MITDIILSSVNSSVFFPLQIVHLDHVKVYIYICLVYFSGIFLVGDHHIL